MQLKYFQIPDLLESFKDNAKAISNEFDIHNIVPKYEDLYQSVLNKMINKSDLLALGNVLKGDAFSDRFT